MSPGRGKLKLQGLLQGLDTKVLTRWPGTGAVCCWASDKLGIFTCRVDASLQHQSDAHLLECSGDGSRTRIRMGEWLTRISRLSLTLGSALCIQSSQFTILANKHLWVPAWGLPLMAGAQPVLGEMSVSRIPCRRAALCQLWMDVAA